MTVFKKEKRAVTVGEDAAFLGNIIISVGKKTKFTKESAKGTTHTKESTKGTTFTKEGE